MDLILPAKLLPPQIQQVFPRKRLYESLKSAETHSLCWIEGPAGCGKTSLAVGYLAHRRRQVLWYQCDERDSDPSSFFHFLALAASAISPARKLILPHLTPDRTANIQAFARDFFEALFASLPRPITLVLDNYQELPEQAPHHGWLADALTNAPPGQNLLVLSRHAPPAAFARMIANQSMSRIYPEQLSLTRDETIGLVKSISSCILPESQMDILVQQTQGWAAGVVLLLKHNRHPVDDITTERESGHQSVFNYFASELLTQMTESDIILLCKLALVEEFDADIATNLGDLPEAGGLIENLWQNNFFLVRHSTNKIIYRYHPLFRQFLLDELGRRLSPAQCNALQRRAANLLNEAGDLESAIQLWLRAGEHTASARAIIRIAPEFIDQGRHQQLLSWTYQLGEETVNDNPWLLFWRASARLPFEPQKGVEDHIRAFTIFKTQDDFTGQYMSCSNIIAFYIMVWREFHSLDRWLDEMKRIRRLQPVYPSHEIEVMVTASMLGACIARRPDDPQSQLWLTRADQLYDHSKDPAEKMRLAHTLLYAHSWIGDSKRLEFLHRSIGHNIDHPATSPIDRVFWYYFKAFGDWYAGKLESCTTDVEKGMQVIDQTGLHMMAANMASQAVYGSLAIGNLELADDYLGRVQHTTDFDSPFNAAHYCYLESWYALDSGDPVKARLAGEQCIEHAGAAGTIFIEALSHTVFSHSLFENNEIQPAHAQLDLAFEIAEAIGIPVLLVQCRLSRAYFDYRQGNPGDFRETLGSAFAMAARSGLLAYPGCPRRMMTTMCQLALANSIERDYVRSLIDRFGLAPDFSLPGLSEWPWPVSISTFGRFQVQRNDEPLAFSRKSQKKPLDLLKILVAYGGERVSISRLDQIMWPDAEGDLARQNLKATIHRLRKLLGMEALIVQDGSLSLNSHYCWLDTWELERDLAELSNCSGHNINQIEPVVRRLQEIYSGPFLPDESSSQIVLARERLRAKYLRAIGQAARQLVDLGRIESALHCFQTGLEIDPLAESLHRGAIRCFLLLNCPAEALAAYYQCRDNLRSHLGVEPAEETTKMIVDLQDHVH